MHPLPAPHTVQIFTTSGWQTIQANVAYVNRNHYRVAIPDVPIWTRVGSLDGVALSINGVQALQVLGSNVTHQVPGSGTLTVEVLLP
jgi:hypothetical protein